MNIEELGIDTGNGYFKFRGQRFSAQVKLGELSEIGDRFEEVHQVYYAEEGKAPQPYIVGQGSPFVGEERYFTDLYRIALLTAVALSCKGKKRQIQAEICIGLPIDYPKELKLKVKNHIMSWGVQNITVDGVAYVIELRNVIVFTEGAYTILEEDKDGISITVDMGAGTINIIEWENGRLVDKVTRDKSYNKVLLECRNWLNSNYRMGMTNVRDVEQYIGLEVADLPKHKNADLSGMQILLKNYITEISAEIKGQFRTDMAKTIKIFGGGAISTYFLWKENFPEIQLVNNSQFVNSEIYDMVIRTQSTRAIAQRQQGQVANG